MRLTARNWWPRAFGANMLAYFLNPRVEDFWVGGLCHMIIVTALMLLTSPEGTKDA